MLENWATFSFPRSLSISITFFLIQLKIKETLNAQPFTAKKLKKKLCNLFKLPSVDFN